MNRRSGFQEWGDCGPDVFVDLFYGSVGVDDAVFFGLVGGLFEVVSADLFVIVAGALFDAVFDGLGGVGLDVFGEGEEVLGFDASAADVDREVEEDGHVGPGVGDRDLGDAADVVGGEAFAAELVGEGAGDEAVGDDG